MKKKVAILGSGPVAESHLSALAKSRTFEPAVIYGRNKERISFLANKFDLIAADSLEEILDGHNVSLVDISTSNDLHYSYALAALQAGISVIVEKPAAFTSSNVETLVDEAQKRDLMVSICFQKRFNKSFKRVLSFLAKGDQGTFLHGETNVFMPRKSSYYKSKWHNSVELAGGGVLIYHAIHDLDLLCLLLGKVKSIDGEIQNTYHSTEVEDTVHLIMNFGSGGTHHFHASTDPGHTPRIETRMVFENGTLSFNDIGHKWSRYKEPVLKVRSYAGNSLKSRILDRFYGLGNYRDILGDMGSFFSKKTDNVTSKLATAVETHRVIETFYNQARKIES